MVAVIVPRRADGGRRDELWSFTRIWLEKHHPEWEIYCGDSPFGPFNRGAALNQAAEAAIADGHEVLVIHDGDNVTDPRRLEEAVARAQLTGKAWFPSDCYIYLDEQSSFEFHRAYREGCGSLYLKCVGHWWPRPSLFKDNVDPATVRSEPGYNASVRNRHISGILAVPTELWEKTGGFVPLTGWGREDAIFWLLLEYFAEKPSYIQGTTIHLWHEHAAEDVTPEIKRANTRILNDFKAALASANPERSLKRVKERYGFADRIVV